MRNWKNWLFPLLTALTVAALALLPLRLSTLEDRELTGTVHVEALTAENNFPSKPPELPGRVWLLAQYLFLPNFLSIMSQEPEQEKLETLSAQARKELEELVELGILPEGSPLYDQAFVGSVLFLRDQKDLSSAAFATLSVYNKETEESLSLYLDGESGQILSLEMRSELLWEYRASSKALGGAFFDRLGLDYELLEPCEDVVAAFRLTDTNVLYLVQQLGDTLFFTLDMDWQAVDDDIRVAMGYPPFRETDVDAGTMQKRWNLDAGLFRVRRGQALR